MARPERQQQVLELLKDLRGIEPLKQLFWSELNYQRVNEPLSRRGWTDSAAKSLADDPVLFAGGGENNDFHVIYGRLASDRLLLGAERPVVARLVKEHPYALFVFSNKAQDRWHFLNVKYADTAEKRRLFRRITVGPEERLRTASERISLLSLDTIHPDLLGIPPLTIQEHHDAAFDVEPVTKEFFTRYREIFEDVERKIRGLQGAEKRRLFTQRLFNRLMFVAFIQKKGWLKFDGDTDYLNALWHGYRQEQSAETNFYRDRLKALFFRGLNNATGVNQMAINRGGLLGKLIGQVPYLNGGLFEEDEEDKDAGIVVPDDCLDAILNQLFARFNFTVTESTPLDVEVAVDPEMLGKVFEELVTGRHETGSYYTPKPVVSFMCREALIVYLQTELTTKHTNDTKEAIVRFVQHHDPTGLRNPEAVLDALKRVRACDLACGSGAYLVGMLHELLDLRACLFQVKALDAQTAYDRKLEIIQHNLYGVDLDPFAVNIARLRLWLSLAVEYEGDDPPPLPNLDFKIEVGDSLTAPNPETIGQQAFRDKLIREFREAKARYLTTAQRGKKQELLKQITGLRRDIAQWTHHGQNVTGFDWAVEFAEVFADGGFDIILANPPYVRADAQFKHITNEADRQKAIAAWKRYREQLLESETYRTLFEKWDLYMPFLERAYQLLRTNGGMVFIIPDAYNAAKYTRKSHEFFLVHSRIERIDFCTEIPLFEAGVNNTILHFTKAEPPAKHQPVRVRRWGEKPDDFDANAEVLPTATQAELCEALFKLDASKQPDALAGFTPLSAICYISYGLRANADDRFWKGEFVTEDLVSDVRDKKHPKPFIEGKDLVRWWATRLRYLEWGTERAPRKFARPTFPQLHEAKEKLIALVVASGSPPVIYDADKRVTTHTSCIFVPWHLLKGVVNKSISKTAKYRRQDPEGDREEREKISERFNLKYVLAVMNSTFAKDWLAKRRRSKIHVYPDDWKQLPIAPLPAAEQQPFVKLVDAILAEYERHGHPLPAAAAQRVAELEREIDQRVAALYGL